MAATVAAANCLIAPAIAAGSVTALDAVDTPHVAASGGRECWQQLRSRAKRARGVGAGRTSIDDPEM